MLHKLNIDTRYQGLYIAVALLLVAAIAVYVVTGVNFFGIGNLLNMSRSFSMLGVAAIGQTVVIISGGLDLSVGAVISVANVSAATFMNGDNRLLIPIGILTILVGGLIGLVNGLLIAKRRVPPFIATLGVAIIVNGIRLIWTKGIPSGKIPPMLNEVGVGTTLHIPNLLFVFLVVAVIISIIMTKAPYGRKLYAVGTNPAAASLCGVRSDIVTMTAYVVCGMTAALVGIMLGGYMGMSDPLIGEGYDLDTIAAAVLGGAKIGGGFGGVMGTMIGACIMLMITNLSLLVHFPLQSQMLLKGGLIIFALWLNGAKSKA
ncbi:MAG: ABC transporter permease [bacterium]|nr:ABC transporter permease [bacterium]